MITFIKYNKLYLMNTFEILDKMLIDRDKLAKDNSITRINKKLIKYSDKNITDRDILKYLKNNKYIFFKYY